MDPDDEETKMYLTLIFKEKTLTAGEEAVTV
jgi:hypothetical protein